MRDPSYVASVLERCPRVGVAPIGFHVTMRLEDDRPIATSVACLRVVSRVVLAQGKARGLLAFGAADDHLHAALVTDRRAAGMFAHNVEVALRRLLQLGARFEPARIRPFQDQRHLLNTFHYVHRQASRHKLEGDFAREGTSLPDHLGLRVLDTSLAARLRAYLPRVERAALASELPPRIFDERPFGLDVVADAAAAALALPDVLGRGPDAARARRAAVHLAGARVSKRILSEHLGFGARAIQSLRTLPPEPLLIRATRLQVLLRTPLAIASVAL